MGWDYKKYGSEADPIRQSDLNEIAGTYGCAARFKYRKELDAEGQVAEYQFAPSKRTIGTAVHNTIARYLTGAAKARLFAGEVPSDTGVAQVFAAEMEKAREGLPVDWKDSNPDRELAASVAMVKGALAGIVLRAEDIVLCEAEFLAEVEAGEKSYWISGTVDVVYVPRGRPGEIGLADWKTGETRLHPILLDHGYQFGFYSHALAKGLFITDKASGSTRSIGQHPSEIYLAHLRDYVPYLKAGTKTVERAEDCEHYGVSPGTKVKFSAGDFRGPAWYRANRTPEQVQRLAHSIRTLVGVVRRGGFVESIGEHCMRCPHKQRCLNEGYGATGDERSALEKNLRGLSDVDDGLAA